MNGIAAIGSGFPVGGRSRTAAPSASPYSFFLADLDADVPGFDTLYIVDDGIGLMKFALVGGTWTQAGTVGVGTDAYRGLTATVAGNTVTLYATRKGGTTGSGGGELVKLVDASGYNGMLAGTPSVIVPAVNNIALRGVALAPGVVTITPSAGANGSISPATPQVVPGGVARTFTVIANAGYTASATGCGGTLVGTTFTTALATAGARWSPPTRRSRTRLRRAPARTAITPNLRKSWPTAPTTSFNVATNPGYSASATGCGGTLSGGTYDRCHHRGLQRGRSFTLITAPSRRARLAAARSRPRLRSRCLKARRPRSP